MKRTLSGMFLALFLSVSAFAGELDFTLVNATGFAISKVFVSPTSIQDWGDDLMGPDMLQNGGSLDIQFSPKADETHWDLKVADKDGNEVFWDNIDLTQSSVITLHFENQEPTVTIE